MVGWSSRHTRDRKRRARWWNSLTLEQQEEETEYQKYTDRRFFSLLPVTFLLTLALLWLASLSSDPRTGMSLVALFSILTTFGTPFLFIKSKQQWRKKRSV